MACRPRVSVFMFGPKEDCKIYLSSADLMTRNLDKRIEIAWPVEDKDVKGQVLDYIDTCLADTVKLRELKSNKKWTGLGVLTRGKNGKAAFNAQEALIEDAAKRSAASERAHKAAKASKKRKRK